MQPFLGMFYAKKTRALQGIYDAPYLLMGRHALCAEGGAFDGGAAALLTGRLRNAADIRRQLSDEGFTVTNGGVSGLLLGAYRMWGEDCVKYLEGPVACIVIDQDAGRLILSRDRMGNEPVFYAAKGGTIAFADHPAPLLEAPGVTRAVDREGFCEIFGLGPARTPGRTPFRDIMALEAGCALIGDGQGHRIVRYFSLEAHEHEHDLPATLEAVRHHIERAMDDVAALNPVSMLSGGVDSTVLTALMARRMNAPIRSFSVDYQDNSDHFPADNAYHPEQDSPWVERAVSAIGSRHTRVELGIEALFARIHEAMTARGLPGMADIDSSLLLFGREIARSGRHVLSGECGDEVFGGYPWFHREDLIGMDGFPWSGSMPLRESVLKRPVSAHLALPQYVADRYHDALCRLPFVPGLSAREARLRAVHGLCFQFFMPNLQERAVRMLGASGVHVLMPFSDDRLAQYVYNIPWTMKNLNGQEKGLLRQAMHGLIPDDLLWRKKSPYPKTYHPAYAQLAVSGVRRLLDDPASPILELVDRAALERLIEGPLTPTPWFGQLMAGPQMLSYLLQVNQWMLRYRVEVTL